VSTPLKSPPPRNTPIVDNSGDDIFGRVWSGWFRSIFNSLSGGMTTIVPLAKLTVGGTNGSLTVVNGIITSVTAPT
jgi:hypothetical protein